MSAPADPIPALAEHAATGIDAEIFADIRATLRVGNVNLVWRHLATLDDALEWAWTAARPLYASGAAARAAAGLPGVLARTGLLEGIGPWSGERLAAAGLDDDVRARIALVLDAYNRGNGLNLVALSALQVSGAAAPGADSGPLPEPPEPPGPSGPPGTSPGSSRQPARLPPLPELDAMTPAVRDSVLALNRLGVEHAADVAVASLYKHLALWPGCLALAGATLAPLDADGTLRTAARTVREAAGGLAAALGARLGAAPDGAASRRARTALPAFTEGAICRMIPVGLILGAALDVTASPPPTDG